MIQSEIEKEVRDILTEPYARLIASSRITAITLDGVSLLARALVGAEPEYFITRKSLQSTVGSMFDIPSDSETLIRIWDLKTNALAITAAADNGVGLIRLTLDTTAHGWETDDVVTIHDVVGTTEANGTWKITDINDTAIDLQGSVFANAWVSGGLVFKETDEFTLIRRQPHIDASSDSEMRYHLRGSQIIVDAMDFEDDILVTYFSLLSTLAEIPTKYHFGLPSYVAMRVIRIPPQDDKNFDMLRTSFSVAKSTWLDCYSMAQAFKPLGESRNLSESRKVRRFI